VPKKKVAKAESESEVRRLPRLALPLLSSCTLIHVLVRSQEEKPKASKRGPPKKRGKQSDDE